MSSTKRGGQRSPADNYPTPNWCVHRFLEEWPPGERMPVGRWLDPGAGEGNIIYSAQEWLREQIALGVESRLHNLHLPPRAEDIIWDAVELRKECKPFLEKLTSGSIAIADYFENGPPTPEYYSVILTNPPFSLAPQFIERSLDANCRFVVMLLRVNYLGSEARNDFMRRHAPDLYVLPNRPSFKLTGETDSIEYGWFVWDKENLNHGFGSVRLLKTTPIDVRKKEHERLKGLGLFFGKDARKRPARKRAEKKEIEANEVFYCAKHGTLLDDHGYCEECAR